MGSEAIRLRAKWQDYSGRNASHAEHSSVCSENFLKTDFQICAKPTEFKNLMLGPWPCRSIRSYG